MQIHTRPDLCYYALRHHIAATAARFWKSVGRPKEVNHIMTNRYVKPRTYYLIALGLVAVALELGRRIVPFGSDDHEAPVVEPPAPAEPPAAEIVTEKAKTVEPTGSVKVYDAKPAASRGSSAKKPAQPKAPKPPASEAPQSAGPASPEAAVKPATGVDDLTQIKGIGPTYARRLLDAGIVTYSDIASSSEDQLRQVTKAATMTDVNEWIAQARTFRQN